MSMKERITRIEEDERIKRIMTVKRRNMDGLWKIYDVTRERREEYGRVM